MPVEQYNFGSGDLFFVRTDIAVPTPVRVGALQDISVDISFTVKDLMGQYQFPLAVARGAAKLTGKSKFAKINARALNDAFFGQTLATGEQVQVVDEGGPAGTAIPAAVSLTTSAATASGSTLTFTATTGVQVGQAVNGTNIPAGTEVSTVTSTTVTLSQAVTSTGVTNGESITFGPTLFVANAASMSANSPGVDLGVYNAGTGIQMTRVSGGPIAGEYMFDGTSGAYNFSTTDQAAGVKVLPSYTYAQTTSGGRITAYNQKMGSSPVFKLQLGNSFLSNKLGLTVYQCVPTKMSWDFKNEDFTIPDFEFSAFVDGLGRFFDWSSDQI